MSRPSPTKETTGFNSGYNTPLLERVQEDQRVEEMLLATEESQIGYDKLTFSHNQGFLNKLHRR